MMKKLIVVIALMLVASSAYASLTDWNLNLQVGTSASIMGVSSGKIIIGTASTATDGVDAGVDTNAAATTSSQGWIKNISKLGGVDAPANGYFKDLRAPVVAETKVWDLQVGAREAYSGSTLELRIWNPTGDANDIVSPLIVEIAVVKDPTGLVNGFTWDNAVNGASNGTGAVKINLTNAIASLKGGSAIDLQVRCKPVPEPGSIVAMLSGLVGLMGYGIRRRK